MFYTRVDGRSNQIKVFVVCVVTAAFIWLMDAINTGVHTVRISYPIRFVYDDSLYYAPSVLPASVEVNVSGRGWRLLTVYTKSLSAPPAMYVVSNPLKASKIDTTLLKEKIAQRFEGFRVEFPQQPWPEDMKFELKSYKVVHLKIDSAGIMVEPGYAVTSYINMSPSLLSVEGPSSLIRNVPDSLVVRIPERGVRSNYESNVPLDVSSFPEVKLSHESVYVSFEVSRI